MSLRQRLQDFLGISELHTRISLHRDVATRIEGRLADLEHKIRVTNSAIGQVIAKLNPILAVPEDDPSRVAQSKKLGDAIIKKLQDEAKVLEHYNLIPKEDQ